LKDFAAGGAEQNRLAQCRHGLIKKQIGRLIAGALYMAALTASQHNAQLSAFYQRLLKAGKLKKVALTAVMRKLLTCLNALLRQQLEHKGPPDAQPVYNKV
jgi:transposase